MRRVIASAFLSSGFRQLPDNDPVNDVFVPCPLGTFANYSTRGAEGCIECPPGTCIPYALKRQFDQIFKFHFLKAILYLVT